MKRIIYKTIIVLLILIEIPFMYLTFKSLDSFNHRDNNVEEVSLNDMIKDRKNSFAIMLQEEDYSWHEAEDRTKWPSPDSYGYNGAKCTDSEGAEVDVSSILFFDLSTLKATIKTKNTIYCTLYFAKGKPALEALKATGGEYFAGGGEHTTAVDGLYRYRGTKDQANNYICFGTTDKEKCLATPRTYLYRIIGLTSEERDDIGLHKNQLKIIKSYLAVKNSGTWGDNVRWESSSPKSYVNTTFLNSIKNGENGTYWESLISSQKWYIGYNNSTSSIEARDTVTSSSFKVGLMYQSDFYNAGNSSSSWLYISNSGPSGDTTYCTDGAGELTMSLQSHYSDSGFRWYYIHIINCYGLTTDADFYDEYSYRPTFYLRPVNLVGTGKPDDPFIIATMYNA